MNDKISILIIEDDQKILNFLSLGLKAKGYQVYIAKSGNEGIVSYCTLNPKIILLDLGLPDMDGVEVIRNIREVSSIPILVLSAREMEQDKISALDAGANDYMTKPFLMGELMARLRVMERYIERVVDVKTEAIYQIYDLKVDVERHRVFLSDEELHLTPLEYKLLVYMIKNRGKVVTHSQIMKNVWGYEDDDATNLRVCMVTLRKKIEKEPSQPKFIFTEIGVGYRFTDF